MTIEPAASAEETAAPPAGQRPALRLVRQHEHVWSLRDTEYDDGLCVRRYECDDCGEVDYC